MILLLAHDGLEGPSRHFLEVGGEPIIERTLRMVEEGGGDNVVLVAPSTLQWSEMCSKWRASRVGLVEPSAMCDIARSIGLLSGVFDNLLFLMGDVVFSKEALSMILDDISPLAFYGNPCPNRHTGKPRSENFAIRVSEDRRDLVMGKALNHKGQAWDSRRLRFELEAPLIKVEDWTDDVDRPEDLARIAPFVRRKA